MLKYLLDTNIVIYVIKQRPRIALDRFNREHGHMAMSSITLAELIHGAEKSNNLREFEHVPGLVLENWV